MLFQLNYGVSELTDPVRSLTTIPLLFANVMSSLFLSYLASASVAKEYEQRTMNILLTTPLRRSEIFFGKMVSLLCLVPLIVVFNAVYFLALPASYGVLPDVVVSLMPYELLLSALYLTSVIVFTMFLSVILRKASLVLIIMVILTFLSVFIGLPAAVTYPFEYRINYSLIFLLPGSVMVSGLMIADSYCIADSPLLLIQAGYILAFTLIGVLIFRRSELWG